MKSLFIENTLDKVGTEVELMAWVDVVRDHKKVVFIDLRDRTGKVQVVGGPELKQFSPEDVVKVLGTVKNRPEKLVNPKLRTGAIEIEAKKVELLSKAHTLPIDMGKDELDVTLPILLDYRPLTLRHQKINAIFRVQEAVADAFREVSEKHGCVEVFIPTIVASSTEGGTEVFEVNYYKHKAYLAQSPQLYKQMLVPVFERVFTISHAYRAEPSVTTRHLSELVQLDCEFGFVTFPDLLDLLETFGVYMVKTVQEKCQKELKLFNVEPSSFGKVPRITLREAQELIFKETGRDIRQEKDLGPADEVFLSDWAKKNRGSEFVTVTHFPTQAKPFYTMPDPNNPEYTLSYDLLFRGVEILSGSQRIHDYEQLVGAIKKKGMNPASFEMYLQAFKYGMPPEGGFSFGLERMTKNILKLENIREASLFPRDMERVDIRLSTVSSKKDKVQ